MAAIDYIGIRDQLKTILEGDSRTSVARVFVEEEPQFGLMDAERAIVVFTDRRVANAPDQSLSAGKRTRYALRSTFWTFAFSIESFKVACDRRDALLADLELVLMENRTIGGKVAASWLEGGDFVNARDGGTGVFVAAAETVLTSEVSAIST